MSRQRDVLSSRSRTSCGSTPRRTTPERTRGVEVNDLKRAVVELAGVRGWHVPHGPGASSTGPLRGLVLTPPAMVGSRIAWPDLTFVRRRDRRLLLAALASDGAKALHPRKRLVIDLLGAICWTPDEHRQAERWLGHPIPRIEVFVWRPADLVAGVIDEVLR